VTIIWTLMTTTKHEHALGGLSSLVLSLQLTPCANAAEPCRRSNLVGEGFSREFPRCRTQWLLSSSTCTEACLPYRHQRSFAHTAEVQMCLSLGAVHKPAVSATGESETASQASTEPLYY
jgi:hypothetical protein